MADIYLLEGSLVDGYLLEDGSGVLLLEAGTVQWSISDKSPDASITNSNLTASVTATIGSVRANLPGTGKFYFEVNVDAVGSTYAVGVADETAPTLTGSWFGSSGNPHGATMRSETSVEFNGGSSAIGPTYTTGDVIGVAVDVPNKLIWWAKNNVWQLSGDPALGTGGKSLSSLSSTIFPVLQGAFGTETATGHFTAASQTYAAPSGFTAIDAVSGNNISGSAALTFTPSATLLGQGAVSASSALVFAPSATLLGKGAVSGSSSLAFSPSGTVNGLISGTSTLLLSPSATLLGKGAVVGSSSLTFTPTATLLGSGPVSGASSLVLSPSATLLGKGAVVGSSTIVFSPSATLFVASAISGTTSLAFSGSGTLLGAGTLLGSTALSLSAAATLLGTGQLQGLSAFTFDGAATLLGVGAVAGTTSFSLTVAGELLFGFTGQVKVHILDAEQAKPVKYWNGSAWVTKPLKYWTGTAWQATSY